MKENLLQYIWNYKLFNNSNIFTVDNKSIRVISTGTQNFDAGPDFFNAQIEIDGTLWAGNVEIHQNSADWEKHLHQNDKSYDSVILHVVNEYTTDVYRTTGEKIPCLVMTYPSYLLENYQLLLSNKSWIPCGTHFVNTDMFFRTFWLEKLLVERMEKKSEHLQQILLLNNYNWEEAFYFQLAKSFGFGLNSEPFEMLAKATPLLYLAKHKNNLFQLEAMLFGQAGLLNDNNCTDSYFIDLQKEYFFLKTKFSLQPIEKHLWKHLRLRPVNFPEIRISQFAQLVHTSSALSSKILEINNIEQLQQLFNVEASNYWLTHYTFGKESKKSTKKLGETAFYSLIINTVVPFIFTYGKLKNSDVQTSKAWSLLENLKPEKNSIIQNWQNLGVEINNAFLSQAYIHLKKEYCDKGKCLQCQIGNQVIRKNNSSNS